MVRGDAEVAADASEHDTERVASEFGRELCGRGDQRSLLPGGKAGRRRVPVRHHIRPGWTWLARLAWGGIAGIADARGNDGAAEAGLPEEPILEQEDAAHGRVDPGEDVPEVRGAEGFGETGEFRAGGTQPHSDDERLAVVEHAAEQSGQALWRGHVRPGPICIGVGGWLGAGGAGGHGGPSITTGWGSASSIISLLEDNILRLARAPRPRRR